MPTHPDSPEVNLPDAAKGYCASVELMNWIPSLKRDRPVAAVAAAAGTSDHFFSDLRPSWSGASTSSDVSVTTSVPPSVRSTPPAPPFARLPGPSSPYLHCCLLPCKYNTALSWLSYGLPSERRDSHTATLFIESKLHLWQCAGLGEHLPAEHQPSHLPAGCVSSVRACCLDGGTSRRLNYTVSSLVAFAPDKCCSKSPFPGLQMCL